MNKFAETLTPENAVLAMIEVVEAEGRLSTITDSLIVLMQQ